MSPTVANDTTERKKAPVRARAGARGGGLGDDAYLARLKVLRQQRER
jgi:hypothetical protein